MKLWKYITKKDFNLIDLWLFLTICGPITLWVGHHWLGLS